MAHQLIRVAELVFKDVLYLLDELMVVSVTSKVGDTTPSMKLTHKKPTFKTTQLRSAQNPLSHPVYGLVNRDPAGCLSCLIRIFIELGSTVPISTT